MTRAKPKVSLTGDRDAIVQLSKLVNDDVFLSLDNAFNQLQDSHPGTNVRVSLARWLDSVMRQCKIDRKAVEAWNKSTFKRDLYKQVPEERVKRATQTMIQTTARLKDEAKEFALEVWEAIKRQSVLTQSEAIDRILEFKVMPGDPEELSRLVLRISRERNRTFRSEVRRYLRELAKDDPEDFSFN